MTVLDALAVLFFLIAGIVSFYPVVVRRDLELTVSKQVMAVKLHTGSCSRQANGAPSDYTTHNYIMNGGSQLDPFGNTVVWLGTNFPKRCREADAVAVFLWFGFALFLISLILDILGRRNKDNHYDDQPYNNRHDLPPPVMPRSDLPPTVQRGPLSDHMGGGQRQPWV